jgi:hypothetical protein
VIRLCTFLDRDPWHKPDKTGCNKLGYLSKKDTVVYPIRRHFVEVPLGKVVKRMRASNALTTLRKHCPEESEESIDSFFTDNVLNPRLMRLGINNLIASDFTYFEQPLHLPKLQPINAEEHKKRWLQLTSCIRRGDLVQVLDESSLVSRLIARVDVGTWSHSARYVGNGKIFEAITSGVVERSILVYADRRYRIGIYRVPNLSEDDLAEMVAVGRSLLGEPYAWSGVIGLAWKKILRLNHFKYYEISPNDLLSKYDYRLIHVV